MDADAVRALDPLGRFTSRAEDYVKYRPDYPSGALGAMLEGLGEPSRIVAADVGAGTGIAARALAELGPRVFAIEPNAAMRSKAAPHPRVEWRDARAEATALLGASVDLVLCAQAFHWFEARPAVAEFARVLRRGGRLALLWNVRDESKPLAAAYARIVRDAAGPAYRGEHLFDPAVLPPRFTGVRLAEFPHAQTLDAKAFAGRALSASYVPRDGAARERIVAELAAAHAAHAGPDGLATLDYVTRLWLADRA